jgi:GH15 family glucan-1,4-alpha-glucosidase
MGYLEARCKEVDEQGGQLQPLYGIHGESHLPEFELDHMEGYKGTESLMDMNVCLGSRAHRRCALTPTGSRPVRVGNGAYNQVQMDIYGELLVRCCHLAEWNKWS